MFSGLIESVGVVRALSPTGGGLRLQVAWSPREGALSSGESIAVNGVCLTVTQFDARTFAADLSQETVARTTMSKLRVGERVNIERSLRLSDRLGGHLVLGHVDATAGIVGARQAAAFRSVRVGLPGALAPEVAEKGSVAVDGVSLTVAAVGSGWFEVALIPATLEATTLGDRRVGDSVNLETDVLAKYVHRALGAGRTSLESLLAGWGRAED